jgi:N-acetylated-alpha-linked acidic dipeptidase
MYIDVSTSLNVASPLIDMMKDLPSSQSIREMFLHYASNAHLAGTHSDYELAEWTRNQFHQFGLKNVSSETYYPYMNYPVTRQLSIISGPEELLFIADLEEEKESTPTFHGK